MSSVEETNQAAPTLENLHRALAMNRLLTLGLGVLILIMLTSWLTLGLFHYFDDAPEPLQLKLNTLEQELNILQEQQTQLSQHLVSQQEQLSALHQAAQQSPSPSSNAAANTLLISTLAGQELSYQQNILAFKEGMRDLARMIPGSRDWLEHYESALERAKADSIKRYQTLEQWLNQQATAVDSEEPEIPH